MSSQTHRWESLDLLRGLSIMGMLLNLVPGAWDKQYSWLVHAKWEGWQPIDMVAPAFLFCIGAALPFSLQSRFIKGETKGAIARHILWRALALIALGLFLNAYPTFDFAHMRLPGVLQRIGIAFAVVGLFVLLTTRRGAQGAEFSLKAVVGAVAFVMLPYWALLQFVPVPGFGAPRFDPVGSWPSYIDRSVFGVPHMFVWWPVDGKVVFDPDGLLSTWPVCATMLLGVLTGLTYKSGLRRPILTAGAAGSLMMLLAYGLSGVCPIIKNIWTPTFILLSGGYALVVLGVLMAAVERLDIGRFLFPVKVFGANPLLAYLICFLCAPLVNMNWIPSAEFGRIGLPFASQLTAKGVIDLYLASLLFSCAYLAVVFVILWICYRKRWFLRL
ncbi:acyltransferase family protein [Asticcacaulis benevestitus]|uniref:DUF5009 domain-containing protein n=1 Tax=Asticcacaulis benevestitus DSM 16100 = ATCC BAA-896 TaxID=1121022 RepID=V4PJS8_9CAUL|nr:hypothetical protein [Asticcacaulis benevestitus]ESQ94212.1 hypothetical protein ABENE_01510 [Asticcacaulis benevestitus DSM 16100 = ATCC BAA-896]